MRTTLKHETYMDLHTAQTEGRKALQAITKRKVIDHYAMEEADAGHVVFLVVPHEGATLTAAVTIDTPNVLEVFIFDPSDEPR